MVAATLVLTGSASAATVGQEDFTGTLDVRAEPGEANAITIEVSPAGGSDSSVVVSDAGATLEAGDECELQQDGSVACEADLYIVTVRLGDQGDTLTVTNDDDRVQHTVYGGEGGDDVVVGPEGDVCIDGEGGDDELTITTPSEACVIDGSGGEDVLTGSDGYDRLNGGEDVDELNAGSGDDYLNGGAGDDLLDGGADADRMSGGEGDDRAFGGAGDDGFSDDEGDDRMHGDAGDDSFSSHFQFGSGDDLYQGGSGNDHMNYFCPRCDVTLNGEADDGRVNKGEHDNVRTDAVSIESHRPRGDEIPPRNYGSGEDAIEGRRRRQQAGVVSWPRRPRRSRRARSARRRSRR